MSTLPELASLQNCLGGQKGGYRCSDARTLRPAISLPDCEFQLVPRGIDTYSIRSVVNNDYLGSSKGTITMASKDGDASRLWKIAQAETPDIYTIRNVADGGYMSDQADKLRYLSAGEYLGPGLQWRIASLVPSAVTSSWMTLNWDLIRNQSLDRVCLPGSHDSGTFDEKQETTFASDRNTRTQLFDIRLQLMQGARVFDLRPAYYEGQFYTAHYSTVPVFGAQGAIGVSLATAFDEMAAFVAASENSRELIILDFSHFSTWNGRDVSLGLKNNSAFAELVRQKLSRWLVCGEPGELFTRTLDELMTDGKDRKNVIAISPTFESDATQTRLGLWNKDYFPTQGAYSHKSDVKAMADKQLENLRTFSHAKSRFMFELCWQLTLSDVGSTPLGSNSILALADVANPQLPTTVGKWMAGDKPSITTEYYPNIINTDACLNSVTQAVQLAIGINKMLKGEKVMAGWTFTEVVKDKVDDMYADVDNELNKLGSSASMSAKVTASDMKSSKARGVVFSNSDFTVIPPRPTGSTWTYQKWHTSNHYDELYGHVRDQLNALTPSQAYHSMVCMTNVKGEDETIALYWLS